MYSRTRPASFSSGSKPNMPGFWHQPDTQRENLFRCETSWLCFAFQFLTLCCLKSTCFGNWTKGRSRKADTCGTALWRIGSPVWRWAVPWQHDCFLVRLSLPQSLHCTRHLFCTFLHCVSQHKMLHHEKKSPWSLQGKLPTGIFFQGVRDISFCIFLRTVFMSVVPMRKKQVRWNLPATPVLGEQRQEDPWLASLAEAMSSRFNETLS